MKLLTMTHILILKTYIKGQDLSTCTLSAVAPEYMFDDKLLCKEKR